MDPDRVQVPKSFVTTVEEGWGWRAQRRAPPCCPMRVQVRPDCGWTALRRGRGMWLPRSLTTHLSSHTFKLHVKCVSCHVSASDNKTRFFSPFAPDLQAKPCFVRKPWHAVLCGMALLAKASPGAGLHPGHTGPKRGGRAFQALAGPPAAAPRDPLGGHRLPEPRPRPKQKHV